MPSYARLNDPTTIDFSYYGTGVPPSRIVLGRTFLAGAYYEDHRNESERRKYEFGQEFFREMANGELPYQQVIVTWNTLATVLAHLDSKWSREQAETCLQKFEETDQFAVHYPDETIYQKALSEFLSRSGNGPNVHEFADYLYMRELNVSMYIDWDSDFQFFEDLTLLPHSYWRQ
jgi:hypothetical protein